jgi:predicted enzyme related to lactoylglutathione lyase
VLVHDDSVQIRLSRGTALLMFRVPDARKIAAALTQAGFKGVAAPIDLPEYHTTVIMAEDPDGNQIEMMQIGPPPKG